jgi:hypothetical protein
MRAPSDTEPETKPNRWALEPVVLLSLLAFFSLVFVRTFFHDSRPIGEQLFAAFIGAIQCSGVFFGLILLSAFFHLRKQGTARALVLLIPLLVFLSLFFVRTFFHDERPLGEQLFAAFIGTLRCFGVFFGVFFGLISLLAFFAMREQNAARRLAEPGEETDGQDGPLPPA